MLLLYHRTPSSTQKETASRFHMDMQIIDAGIIHGFETLIKICGYIILFSIFCEMLQTLPFPAHWFSLAATGFLEVTNGVALLSTSACTRQIKPDRPLAPELCITENNPLTVNRWMLYSFTLPGHPHLKLKYW